MNRVYSERCNQFTFKVTENGNGNAKPDFAVFFARYDDDVLPLTAGSTSGLK